MLEPPTVTVFGAAYSVYVRVVRLALEEKGVPYRLTEVDVFGPSGPPPEHLRRHPFGRIPAFDHAGFPLYETAAITRYIDEAFDGLRLQPVEPQARARMSQVIAVLGNYAYRPFVWELFVERVRAPAQGRAPDDAKIEAALPKIETCLRALEDLMGDSPYLAGSPTITLADLHAAPMFIYLRMTPEGDDLLSRRHTGLGKWLDALQTRASIAATRSPLEERAAASSRPR